MERAVIARKIHFSCGLRYLNPEWSEEKNKEVFGSLYSAHGFGHNFSLEAYICGDISPESGLIIDIRELDNLLKKVTSELDHKFLNEDVVDFKTKVPTPENIAHYLFSKLNSEMKSPSYVLQKIRLHQGDSTIVEIEGTTT